MTKDKAKELVDILLAYSNGKTIQIELNNGWKDIEELKGEDLKQATIRSMGDYLNLRIKPEPKLVPFTLEDKDLFLGKIIKNRRSNLYNIIVGASQQSIWIGSVVAGLNYFELWERYEFEDGSPCGKYVEE